MAETITPPTSLKPNRLRHLVRSSIWVMAIFGLNKITGFGKLLLMTSRFGAGAEADAFAAASQLPELFQALLSGGALSAALIPVYSAYLLSKNDADARALAGTVLTLTLLLFGLVSAGAAYFAPWITQVLLVPDFSPAQQQLTAGLMQITLISTIIVAVASVVTTLLHANQHFLMPAWGTVVIDVGHILGLLFLAPRFGIYGVAWGSVVGALLLLAIQLPEFTRRQIAPRLRLAWRLAGMRDLGHLMWPRIITLSTFEAVDLVFIRLASQLPDGSISAYYYALLVMVSMPRSLFSTAIASVIFPTLSEQFNTGEQRDLRQTVVYGLHAVMSLIVPSALGLVALGPVAITFLFQRGSFNAEDVSLVYGLIAIFGLRLIVETAQDILFLPFYAHHDTRTPMLLNVGWMVLNLLLSIIFVGKWGIHGLAAAGTIAATALTLALYAASRSMVWRNQEGQLVQLLGAILLSCAAMVAVIAAVQRLALPVIPYLVLAIGAGGAAYVICYYLLIGRRLWRMRKRVGTTGA